MNDVDIKSEVQTIVRDVLDRDDINLHEGTTADTIRGWDSLAHVRIMVAIEKYFKIRFDVDELGEMTNVGVLIGTIKAKL